MALGWIRLLVKENSVIDAVVDIHCGDFCWKARFL